MKREKQDASLPVSEDDFGWQEKEKIRSEINTYYSKYLGKKYCIHLSYGLDHRAYAYYFINNGFDEYEFRVRTLI